MKLLFIANTCPLPATNGLTLRSSSVLRALRALGHEVFLLTYQQKGLPLEAGRELANLCCGVRTVRPELPHAGSGGNYWDRLKKLPRRSPYGLFRFRSSAMSSAVRDLLREQDFEAILCDTIDAVIHLQPTTPVPLIVNNHNVEHLIVERYAGRVRNWAKKTYARLEAVKVRRWERAVCGRASFVWVCSEHDRAVLRQLCPDASFSVVPNVVDPDSYAYEPCATDDRTILYTGGMDWLPNRDAVAFFSRKILPKILEEFPQAKFVVAGRSPSEDFRSLCSGSNVVFTGTVPDMRPYIAGAAVCVVPLRIGSGTRLKILEAAALGRAVVSTTLGAEGLEFVAGEEILLADDPARFGECVAGLLRDRALRERLGASARRRVRSDYTPANLQRAIAPSLRAIGQNLVGPGTVSIPSVSEVSTA